MIYSMVEYVNKYGKISVKAFANKVDTEEFVARLEKRGCEYLLTVL